MHGNIFAFVVAILLIAQVSALGAPKRIICGQRLSKKYRKSSVSTIDSTSAMQRMYRNSYDDDEGKGLSLKVLGILSIGVVGLFGSDLFGNIGKALRDAAAPQVKTSGAQQQLKSAGEARGSMTRLTRKEVNEKLEQVPVFFVKDGSKGIYTNEGTGTIFLEKDDAEDFAKSVSNGKVVAGTLGDVYYTLVEKKTKLGAFIEGIVGESDAAATYHLKPSSKQVQQTTPEWRQGHSEFDVPLFRVENLAFSKESGLEVPLFLHREDALTAFQRLQESKKQADPNAQPTLQLTSVADLIALFNVGGFEGRALEVYPAMENIEAARTMMGYSSQ